MASHQRADRGGRRGRPTEQHVVDDFQLVVGKRVEKGFIHAALQEAELATWAGIERNQLGTGLAMAGQHDAFTGRDPGQQGREVRLCLLDVDAAR